MIHLRKVSDKKLLVALEISYVGDVMDVERVLRRADILSMAFELKCVSMVLAKEYTEGAVKKANECNLLLL